MKDNWIPGFRAGTFIPLSPIPDTAKVRYLLNEAGSGWEVHDELAEVILQIPISRHGHGEADFVSWPHDKYRQYSVRSAYNLARSEKFFCRQTRAGLGSSSDRGADEKKMEISLDYNSAREDVDCSMEDDP
jgi:hypothetical protein